ncbi:hypothetical protein JKI95_04715 [Corynebacterium aquatimens]|uniref:hypothetical protein n=1 Tax=Corynebacterium aquatimens TaxID=1190508 RepID=UPI00253FDE11|nr:hypothetical protein [Corynebacterium aquatimens]QYH20224.1 hypothetical protein JKI95_04715 [Corynebacterium aquatimens]
MSEAVAMVNIAPGVSAGQKAAVASAGKDVIGQVKRCSGQDFTRFRGASLTIGLAGCGGARGEVARRNTRVSVPRGAESWFLEVGITRRERADAAKTKSHFDQVDTVSKQIRNCCSAIEKIKSTMRASVEMLIRPAKRMLEIVLKFALTKLIPIAVELVLKAIKWALDITRDGNGLIELILDGMCDCLEDAAGNKADQPVRYRDNKCHYEEAPGKQTDTVAPPPAPTPAPNPGPVTGPAPSPAPTVTLPPELPRHQRRRRRRLHRRLLRLRLP